MLKHRIASGCILGAAVAASAFCLPAVGVWLVLIVVSSLAQWEFYAMVRAAGTPVFRVVGVLCGAALISATFFTLAADAASVAAAYRWEQLVLIGAVIAVFVRQFPQKHNDRPIGTIACTLFGIWYVPFLLNFFTRLALMGDDHGALHRVNWNGRMLIFYLVVVVKCTDIGAFFTGKLIGRHKLFPRISPAKTWEGLAGGLAAAAGASLLFRFAGHGRLGGIAFGTADAAGLGIALALTGVVGDLFESLLKRACATKDSGASIPGMGGLLDVLDSLLFGAPVLYVYVCFFLK